MIRIRNLLSIKFFELYLYISLRNVSPQTLNSEVPFDPSGSPAFLQNNFARFAFSQLLCFSFFHRSFAATGWPEKHSSPFKTISNTWEVFCSYFLSQYSSPFSTWNVSAKSLWISGLFRFVCRSNAFLVFSLQKLFPFLGTFFQKKHSTSFIQFISLPCVMKRIPSKNFSSL